MTPLDININTATKAAQELEKKITDTPNIPGKELITLTKQLNEYLTCLNMLVQIKAVRENKAIIKPINGLITQ